MKAKGNFMKIFEAVVLQKELILGRKKLIKNFVIGISLRLSHQVAMVL